MLNYKDFVLEKFDYKKQKSYIGFDDLKSGDKFYVLLGNGIIETADVNYVDIDDNIVNISKKNSLICSFDLNYCCKNIGVQTYLAKFNMIASTDKDLLNKFKESKYYNKYRGCMMSPSVENEKDMFYKWILGFMKTI